MIDYVLLISAVWLMWESMSLVPSPLGYYLKQREKPELQKIMEREGASLDDVPGSFLPKEIEREIERRKEIRRLNQLTKIKAEEYR
jgi:hypothetical protein